MNDNTPNVTKENYIVSTVQKKTKPKCLCTSVIWIKQQGNNKNIKTKSCQSFPSSTKYHKIQIIQSVQISIKIQYTRVVCVCVSFVREVCCTDDTAKADPLLFLREQVCTFTTMFCCEGLETAGDFVLLPTADALGQAWIRSRTGTASLLGPSQFQAHCD